MNMITQEQVRDRYIYHADGYLTYRETAGPRAMQGSRVGFLNAKGYVSTEINGKFYRVHRLIFLYHHGYFPEQTDHINGIRDDNRISNLRDVSNQENHKNQKMYCTNTSGHMGVYWYKRNKKWGAQIPVDGKGISLGLFTNKQDAITARKAGEIQYGFHENHGRTA